MRHLNDKTYLNRTKAHRDALISNMSASLFLVKKIETTIGKARFVRRQAERMITFARRGDLAARRHVATIMHDEKALKVLFDELGPHFKTRDGGYTRIIKLGSRRGDAAEVVILELTGFNDEREDKEATKKPKVKSKLKTATSAVKAETAKAPKKAKAVKKVPAVTEDEKATPAE